MFFLVRDVRRQTQNMFLGDDHGFAGAADSHDGVLSHELIEAGAGAADPHHGALSHALMEAGGAVTASDDGTAKI